MTDYKFANDIQTGTSEKSNDNGAIISSQQETPKGRGKRKRLSTEKALESQQSKVSKIA
jgi:hypothetical protein